MNFTKTVFSDMIKNTLSLIMIPQRRDGKVYQIVDEWSELEEGREPRAIQRFVSCFDCLKDLCTLTPTKLINKSFTIMKIGAVICRMLGETQGIVRGRGEALIITSSCQTAVFRPTEIDGVE